MDIFGGTSIKITEQGAADIRMDRAILTCATYHQKSFTRV
jgi:hypothetical protein